MSEFNYGCDYTKNVDVYYSINGGEVMRVNVRVFYDGKDGPNMDNVEANIKRMLAEDNNCSPDDVEIVRK